MDILIPVIGIIIAIVLLFVVVKILKGCLVKLVIGLIVLGAAACLVYFYLIR